MRKARDAPAASSRAPRLLSGQCSHTVVTRLCDQARPRLPLRGQTHEHLRQLNADLSMERVVLVTKQDPRPTG